MKRFTMTPQPRKSIKIATSSIRPIPLSSRLSLNADDIKPARNVRDKQYKQECIENITNFLVVNGYDGQLTAKTLASPSSKDFQNIFKFIFSFIDSTPFVRFEDDVMSIIKMLKYQYSSEITRSQLSAVTPHTWPVLLSMINWLVQLIKQTDENTKPTQTVEIAFLEHVSEGYVQYMDGEQNDEEFDSEFIARMEKLHAKESEEINEIRKEYGDLELELEKVKSRFGGSTALEKKKTKIVEDLNSLILHERQLENKKNKYITVLEKLADEIKRYEESINELIIRKGELMDQINQQTINPEDVKGMNVEKVSLFKELERMKPEREVAVKNLLSVENGISERVEENERIVNEMQGMQLIGFIEKELTEIKEINSRIGNLNELSSGDVRELGTEIIKKLEKRTTQKREQLVGHEIHIATVEETIAEKASNLKDLEEQHGHLSEKLKTIGSIYLEKKEIADRTRQKGRNEMDKLDNDLLKLKLESDSLYLKSEKELSEAKIKLDILQSAIEREREEISKVMWNLNVTVEQQMGLLSQFKREMKR